MTVCGASRAGGEPPGQDRWTTTDHGVIVLDGATAFDPTAPPADHYVDVLLDALSSRLDSDAALPLVIRDAITHAAQTLALRPGAGPSSTVLLLREFRDCIEVAALGDSTAVIGLRDGRTERLTDTRIEHAAPEERARYRQRLSAGSGYDETHAALLRAIQRGERAARNTPAGYWIAEADESAGNNAIVRRFSCDAALWCVLATDGAQRVIDHNRADWAALPRASVGELVIYLDDLQRWETQQDPDGTQLPRAKRNDDKTIVTWKNG